VIDTLLSAYQADASMKRLVSLLLCLSLSLFAVARAMKPSQMPTGQKVDAKTLLDDANKALAAMIKAARADNGLDPKTPKNKPFWKSTQLIAKNLKIAKTGLTAKSDDFFKGIAEARQAEEQLKVDWELTDSKNSQAIENGKKLEEAYAENESFDMSESEANEVPAEEDTDEEVASADDDSMEDASDDEGEDVVDDDGGDDDSGGDDNGGDDGGDDGGGDDGD
jgi:hypothetical protein